MLFRAIKPGKPFQSSIFRDEVTREAQEIEKDMRSDFERTVTTWKDKPKFKSEVRVTGIAGVLISVTTKDKRFVWTDLGTKAHIIRAKTEKGLLFRVGGEPKTEPQVILSTHGKPGTKWVRKDQVRHPGTKPRKFSETIRKSYSKDFRKRIQNALDRAARRTGYAAK